MTDQISPRRCIGAVSTLLTLVLLCAVFALVMLPTAAADQPAAGSAVRIDVGEGHGSGVHIGAGYVLTAAHVVQGSETVSVKLDTDEIQPAEVLWSNAAYDVAMVRIPRPERLQTARLSCVEPAVGSNIRAFGDPLAFRSIITWGHVSGSAQTVGNWREAIVVDISIAPGNSGGPIYDDAGNVVGLVVGASLARIGMGSLTGLNIAVPGSTVCMLLGRQA